MIRFRQTIGISFRELELGVFQKLQEMFVAVMQDVLKELDGAVLRLREKKRYEVKEVVPGVCRLCWAMWSTSDDTTWTKKRESTCSFSMRYWALSPGESVLGWAWRRRCKQC
ncbi:MAG TPA: hypothetical protein GX716_10270 [Firmicutes bacterium]|jgi:hypothetical protein|nr:hypothetical protein [Candidatus Fermentithermobacillaceae bacterium]